MLPRSGFTRCNKFMTDRQGPVLCEIFSGTSRKVPNKIYKNIWARCLFRCFFSDPYQGLVGAYSTSRNHDLVGGVPIPLKSMKVRLVSWDDDIPNIWKVIKHVPNHQPVIVAMIRGVSFAHSTVP